MNDKYLHTAINYVNVEISHSSALFICTPSTFRVAVSFLSQPVRANCHQRADKVLSVSSQKTQKIHKMMKRNQFFFAYL
jgi:hypothetical protein